MHPFPHFHIMPLVRDHGVIVVGAVTALESMGIPAPGESLVIAAAVYAATTHDINIVSLVVAVTIGAIIGDNIGYVIGRQLGFRLIARFGSRVGLTPARAKLGRYLFSRYGGRVVLFSRFVAVLRTFAALLAGANRMDWPRFMLFNAIGGGAWAALYGFGAYLIGHEVRHLEGPLGLGFGALALTLIGSAIYFLRHNEARLQREAELAFPDE